MSAPAPSVGRMIASGLEAVPRMMRRDSPRTRHEAMARGMLDHLLRDRRARRRFARRVGGLRGEDPTVRTTARTAATSFDLVARPPAEEGTTGTLAVKLLIDGPLDPERVAALLGELDEDPESRLLLVVPRSRQREAVPKGTEPDPRLLLVTWAKIAERLVAKDGPRAALWTALAEFGENQAVEEARQPVAPTVLLDRDVTTEMRAHLHTMLLVSEELIGRPPRFSSSRSHPRAWLHAGASGSDLGVEFDAVEDGAAVWMIGSRPRRSFALGIGALPEPEQRQQARERLRAIAAEPGWRDREAPVIDPTPFLGEPATRALEDARSLLWEVFDPGRLEGAGFPLVPRKQVDLDPDRLAVRVHAPDIPRSGTFLVSIGGSARWRTLLPRVTREFDGRTYVIQAKKGDTAADLVDAVHGALRSLATKP